MHNNSIASIALQQLNRNGNKHGCCMKSLLFNDGFSKKKKKKKKNSTEEKKKKNEIKKTSLMVPYG